MKKNLFRFGVLLLSLILLPVKVVSQPATETLTVRGQIVNGTTGQPAKADRLELIELNQGMQIKQVLQNAGPVFEFRPFEAAQAPVMIRAMYQDQPYVTMIPPVSKNRNAPQKVTVYETGYEPGTMQVNSGLQLTRTIDGILVARVYAVANESNRTIPGEKLVFFVPDSAKDLKVTARYRQGMPIDLSLKKEGHWHWTERGFRPGFTEMAVEFTIEDDSFEERPDRIAEMDTNQPDGFSRVILWRPPDAKPQIEGADQVKEVQVPDLGSAIQASFSRPVTITMDSGSVWFENPMQSDTNPVFNSATITIAGILIVLAVIFSLLALLSGFQIRIHDRNH